MFAKLFDTEDHGQILVKMDTAEDGSPEVRIYFEPEGLGVCSVAFAFRNEDEDAQWDKVEKFFEATNQASCSAVVKGIKDKMLSAFVAGDEQ